MVRTSGSAHPRKAVLYVVSQHEPGWCESRQSCAPCFRCNLNREWNAPVPNAARRCSWSQAAWKNRGQTVSRHSWRRGASYVFLFDRRGGARLLDAPGSLDSSRAFRSTARIFQTEHGYLASRFRDELLTLTSQVGRPPFQLRILTLEMPFQRQRQPPPDGITGWNGERNDGSVRPSSTRSPSPGHPFGFGVSA